MPGTFTYGLYPWRWLTESGQSFHAPPDGAASVLDFRPLPAQGTQGQSAGWGLFAWPDSVVVPKDLVSLGSGYVASIQPSTAARNELRIKLGLSAIPAGATLADCLADVLGALSDPTGATGPKPLMPMADGTLEIQLAGHSRVWSSTLDVADLLAANPKAKNSRIRDVIRAGIDTADESGGLELASKVLGSWLLTCGISREEIKLGASGKKSQWDRLLSTKIKAKHGNNLKPKEPKTSFSEAWPTNGAITSGQNQTWSVPRGGLQVVGNRLRTTANFEQSVGLCAAAVSSTNHFSQLLFYSIGQPERFGTATRLSDDGFDFYSCAYTYIGVARRLHKSVAGALTVLATSAYSFSANDVFKCKANGSSLTGTVTGETDLTTTDTAITGSLKGGVWLHSDTNNHTFNEWGAWTIDDELPAAPVAAFSGTPLTGSTSTPRAFTDSSTNTPTSWLWEKSSDGGSNWANFAGTPTAQNPTEELSAGTWSVRLTATNAGGSDGETKIDYLVASAAGGGKNLLLCGVG